MRSKRVGERLRTPGQGRMRGASDELRVATRSMRKRPTPAEQRLWDALRNRQLNGLRFRRQHSLGTFIFDLYCPEHRLVIEVDGMVHEDLEQAARDSARTTHLESAGYTVIRFTNDEVLQTLSQVLLRISTAASKTGNQ